MKKLWVSKNTYFLAMALGAGLLSFAQDANATDQDVQATVQTRQAISMSVANDMDFGIIDYVGGYTGNIQLGTDSSVTFTGAGLSSTGGTPAAALVSVSGDGTSTADISCEIGGTLSDGGVNTLTLTSTEIAVTTPAAFGSGTACAGLGSTLGTHINFASTDPANLYMGGAIDSSDPIDGSYTYSTSVGGGDPVTLRVVYQ